MVKIPIESTFFIIALFVYATATLHYLLFLVSGKKGLASVARISTYTAFIVHTMAIGNLLISAYSITGRNVLSIFAWAIALVYIVIELRYKVEVFGSFVVPIIFLSIVFASVLPVEIVPALSSSSSVLKIVHILCAFLGYGAFAVVFASAVMYLFQEGQLKSKRQGFFYYRLPSLEVLDKVGYNCLLFGFPFLTVAIISGIVWAGISRKSFVNWKIKEIYWVLTWVVYGILLHARILGAWRGRNASYMAIVAFALAYLILLL